jgi:hypothetical protein
LKKPNRVAVLVAFLSLNFSAAFDAVIPVPTLYSLHEIIDPPAGSIVVRYLFFP